MNVDKMMALTKKYILSMVKSPNESTQRKYVAASMDLMVNTFGVFLVERLKECQCMKCRKTVDDLMRSFMARIMDGTVRTINVNLKAQGIEQLYEETDPAEDPDVNRATYDLIMKELKNDN